jgi:signal transduction histidine kinase
MHIERQPVDLGALAGRIVAEFQQMVGAWDTRHSIHLVCPEEPLVVEGDEMQLELVLRNLLDNAIKYSPKSGSVEVCIEQRGDQAWLGVRDQGIGIPEEAQAHLFRRFYRGDNAGQQQSSGMGIGLYLVKEIVSLHGGSVEVRSKAGQGSTFGICLPLAHALAQQQATSVIASAA